MTDAEAEAMLKALSEHYRCPVMPVERYCDALTTWFRIVQRLPAQFGWAEHVPYILLGIQKSNLLARLIYGGEKLRTEPCPEHKGRWTGVPVYGDCDHGCALTGWLPEPHAYEPVDVRPFGEHAGGEYCRQCGGTAGGSVHLPPDDTSGPTPRAHGAEPQPAQGGPTEAAPAPDPGEEA